MLTQELYLQFTTQDLWHTHTHTHILTSSDLGLCLSCMLQTCRPVGLRRMAVSVGSRGEEGGVATPPPPSFPSAPGAERGGGEGEKDSSSNAMMRELSMTK